MMQNDKFAPNSYFFTDPAAITQTGAQAFGPVSVDEFQLTAKFTLAAAAPAYAICKAVVLVQQQTANSSKVNLILRPFNQPIQGINIKYFIYRGLNKADFFTGTQVLASSGSTSDFINKINTQFSDFYVQQSEVVPVFLSKYIGFDPSNQAGSLMLNHFFFKQSEYVESGGEFEEVGETAYELPVIDAGATLGNFTAGECGMDVVLNYGDFLEPASDDKFLFNLAYARAAGASINIAAETDPFKRKLKKEPIFQFLDIAAYYGFHASTDKGVVNLLISDAPVKKTGEAIYNDLLVNFETRNRMYLYIQSDRTRSYNFYNNYLIDEVSDHSLMLGIEEETLAAVTYATDEWPLLIDETVRDHSDLRNKLYLQLVTDNNANTVLYGQVAEVENAQANNFIDADNLRLPLDVDGNKSIFTKVILLSNPSAGMVGSKQTISTFNILLYQGKVYEYLVEQVLDEDNEVVNVLAEPNFFDDVFGDLDSVQLFTNENNNYSNITFQRLSIINHYIEKQLQGITAVQTIRVNDEIQIAANQFLSRVIYITESVDTLTNATAITDKVSSDTKSAPSFSRNVSYKRNYELPQPYYYDLIMFSDDSYTVSGVQLRSSDGANPAKVILGLTKTQNDALTDLVLSNSITNSRIFLIDLFNDNENLISLENVPYQKYSLGVVGEDSQGILGLFVPEIPVIVYSIDRLYHFTREYSDNIEAYQPGVISLDLNVNLPVVE